MLSRAGRGVQTMVGVPCLAMPGAWDRAGSITREPEGLVTGVLLLYSSVPLEETPQVLSYAVNTILLHT